MTLLYWALPSKGIVDLMTNRCTGKAGAVTVAQAPFLQTAVTEPLFRWEPYDKSYAADPLWTKEGRLLTKNAESVFLN